MSTTRMYLRLVALGVLIAPIVSFPQDISFGDSRQIGFAGGDNNENDDNVKPKFNEGKFLNIKTCSFILPPEKKVLPLTVLVSFMSLKRLDIVNSADSALITYEIYESLSYCHQVVNKWSVDSSCHEHI